MKLKNIILKWNDLPNSVAPGAVLFGQTCQSKLIFLNITVVDNNMTELMYDSIVHIMT